MKKYISFMIDRKANRIAIFLLLFLPALSMAQTPDIALWTGIGAKKKLNKDFSLILNTQVRLTDNVSILRAYLGEAGLSYKINKHWEVSGYYRYIGRRKKNEAGTGYEYRPYHRFYADLEFDHKLWKLTFDYRLRYQHQFQDNDNVVDNTASYFRNKFQLSFPNKTMFSPYISTDIFYQIGDTFDQMRNKAGIEIDFSKHHQLDLSVFTDYRLVGSQENRLIMGANYRVKF